MYHVKVTLLLSSPWGLMGGVLTPPRGYATVPRSRTEKNTLQNRVKFARLGRIRPSTFNDRLNAVNNEPSTKFFKSSYELG